MKNLFSGFLVILGLVSISAMSAPTVQVKGGHTSIGLSADMMEALVGCEIDRVKPGNVKPGGERLRFPISGGAIDLDTQRGEVEHRGGFSVSCDDEGNLVTLENFRIEALAESGGPIITALTSVNGTVDDRISFLLPGVEGIEVSLNGGTIQLRKATLQLAPEAKDFLNSNLALTPGLAEATIFGESSSRLNMRMEKSDDDDQPGNGLAKDKDKGKDKDKDEDKDKEEHENECEDEDEGENEDECEIT